VKKLVSTSTMMTTSPAGITCVVSDEVEAGTSANTEAPFRDSMAWPKAEVSSSDSQEAATSAGAVARLRM